MAIDYNKRQPAPQPTPPAGGNVSLSKVTLTKSAPTVNLSKGAGGSGSLRVNLNWNSRPGGQQQAKGFLKRLTAAATPGIDLDLGCLYEFSDGSKGVVQALGNSFEARAHGSTPVIRLDGDDRSGSNSGGENMFVDLSQLEAIRRILVFALIYQGTPNWAEAAGVVTLYPTDGPQIEVRLDETDPSAPICAIALLENVGGQLQVRREVRYIHGAQDVLDQAYGFGLNWRPGRK
ncbi:TerD family protein [Motilibacter aurantiacus]|uniref:TerD family protein n=1 Tax=Motilibacter aurantiacus TaxID=2714955 RepID=UPI001409F8AC|nr:tellurium resistance protein [Motilibacter aurantiacus]NHC44853.1 tellurium resistance protein [Motilibacter aurantiacus]